MSASMTTPARRSRPRRRLQIPPNITQERIHLDVVNCGVGRQSAFYVLSMLAGLWPKAQHVIFSDTGWERPSTLRYWDRVIRPACERAGVAFHKVRRQHTHETQRGLAGDIRFDTLRSVREGTRIANAPYHLDKGPGCRKGQLNRCCTREYKIDPIVKKIRSLAGMRPYQHFTTKRRRVTATQVIGIAAEESQRCTHRTPSPELKLIYPLVEAGITTQECEAWISSKGYPLPEKSACIGCPYRSDASWARMKRDHPDLFANACQFDERLRHPNGLGRLNDGMTEADYLEQRERVKGALFPAYLHPSLKPLSEVDFSHVDPEGGEAFGGDFC